jgi:GNAT superfamily N-acetyltransferase
MTHRAVEIRFAREPESPLVSSILIEAATWAAERCAPIWPIEQLGADAIVADVVAERVVVAIAGADAVGTARLTRDDPECWPDAVPGVAVYVHRIAIRRAWAGCGLPGMILAWCGKQAHELGCSYLRLDCDANRPKLCKLYEGLGFRFHSERSVGRYTVARYERALSRNEPGEWPPAGALA